MVPMNLAKPSQVAVGRKDDKDKLRYDLLDVGFEEEMAKVITEGAKKYEENNWKNVPNAKERYYAALRRHTAAYRKGELINEEDGNVSTLAQIAINAMFLYVLSKEEK